MLLAPVAAQAQTGFSVGATAYVGGDGANLTSGPSWDAASVGFAPAGTTVSIMEAGITDAEGSPWYKVGADASTGYLEGYLWGGFLSAGSGGEVAGTDAESTLEATAEAEWTPEPEWTAEPEWTPEPTATVASGAYATRPANDGSVDESENEWESADGDGEPSPTATTEAWVDADAIDDGGVTVTPVGGETEATWTATTDENPAGATTTPVGEGVIVNTGGEEVRCRAAQSIESDVLDLLREGQRVELLGQLGGEWVPVLCGGRSGFVYGDYVTQRTNGTSDASSEDAGEDEATESATAETTADDLDGNGETEATGNTGDDGAEGVTGDDVDAAAEITPVPEPTEVPEATEVTEEPTVEEDNADGSGDASGAYAEATVDTPTGNDGRESTDDAGAEEPADGEDASVADDDADVIEVPAATAESDDASDPEVDDESGSGDVTDEEATAESTNDAAGADEQDEPEITAVPEPDDEATTTDVAEGDTELETTAVATDEGDETGAQSTSGGVVSVRANGDVQADADGADGEDGDGAADAETATADLESTVEARSVGGDDEQDDQTGEAGLDGQDGQAGRDGADGADGADATDAQAAESDAADTETGEADIADAGEGGPAVDEASGVADAACRTVSRVGDRLSVRTRNASVRVQSVSGAQLRAAICEGPNRAETADADAEAAAADAEAAAETAVADTGTDEADAEASAEKPIADATGGNGDTPADAAGTPTTADGSDAATDTDDGAAPRELEVTAAQHTGSVTVEGTNGQGLRCRDAAGFNADVLTVISEGTSLPVRGDQTGDWLPVVCDGMDGYIYASYGGEPSGDSDTGAGSTATATATATDDGVGGPSTSGYATGDRVQVANTGGGGVRFRSSPSFDAPVITVLGEGTVLSVVDGSTGGWVAVSNGGSSGYIYQDFLAPASGGTDDGSDGDGTPDPGDDDGSSGTDALGPGDHAVTTAYINFRYQPSFTGSIGGAANAGTVVLITGVSQDGFYPVEWAGQSGYMYGEYLSWTDAPLSGDDGGDPGSGNLGGNPGGGNPGGGTGSIDGITGGQSYPISQEFGRTDFSVTTDIYNYGTAYGLDGYSHTGLDVGMPAGTPLYSPVDGTVMIAGGTPYYTYYGNGSPGVGELLIQKDNGDQIVLGHMSVISVSVGQRVSVGDPVGLSGGENGDHLHLEVRVLQPGGNYIIVDPRSYLGGL